MASGHGKQRILIVDDTPDNIHILMNTLKDEYAILAATNGEKALTLATAEPTPDIILLDVMMPGIDGYEVCAQLKNDVRTKNIPVIFITALTEEENEAKGLALGAVDYVTKPFRPAIVKARVRNHLELKRYRDDLEEIVEQQVDEIADSHMSTIFALSKLAESRDGDTGKHLERVQHYCRVLAENLGSKEKFKSLIDNDYIETIVFASPLHDIGKVAIPDSVLCKQGKLTDEEYTVMKSHTTRGAETIQEVTERHPSNAFLLMGMAIAHWHHEKWDGTGYPDGIAGERIPLSARIMALADVYDALTSVRCYKPPFSHEKSTEIILEGKGKHFDPDVVDAFLDTAGEFDRIRIEKGNE